MAFAQVDQPGQPVQTDGHGGVSHKSQSHGRMHISVLLCLALSLLMCVSWTMSFNVVTSSKSQMILTIVAEATFVASYIVSALFWRRLPSNIADSQVARAALLLGTGAMATVGYGCFAYSLTFEVPGTLSWLGIVGTLLFAICEPPLALACYVACCRRKSDSAILMLAGSLAISSVLTLPLSVISERMISPWIVAIFPMLAAVLFLVYQHAGTGDLCSYTSDSTEPPMSPRADSYAERLPMWLFVLMVVYDLVYHVIISIDPQAGVAGVCGLIAVAMVNLFVVYVRRGRYSPMYLYKTALPCIVASLMCLTISAAGQLASAVFANIASGAFYLFAMGTFIMLCQRHELDPVRSFGLFLAAEHIGHLSGDIIAVWFTSTFPNGGIALQVICVVVAAFMVVVSTVVVGDLEVARLFGLVPHDLYARARVEGGDAGSRVSVMSQHEAVAWQCSKAARQFGLTIREEEILELMMLGLTTEQMAERLTLSEGTIKTHVSHLCRKLEVESREEAVQKAADL